MKKNTNSDAWLIDSIPNAPYSDSHATSVSLPTLATRNGIIAGKLSEVRFCASQPLATTFGVHLMAAPEDRRSPLAVALEWVSRITAVALMMVLPGLLGYWLDGKLGTRFLTPVGFVFGVVGAVWTLLLLTGAIAGKSDRTKGSRPKKNQEDQQS